jgi:hypothetical protein
METTLALDDIIAYRKLAKRYWKVVQGKRAKAKAAAKTQGGGYFSGWLGSYFSGGDGAAAEGEVDPANTTAEDFDTVMAMARAEEDFERVNSESWVALRTTVRLDEVSVALQHQAPGTDTLATLAKVALVGNRVRFESRPAAAPAAMKVVYSLSKMTVSMVRPAFERRGGGGGGGGGSGGGRVDSVHEVLYPLAVSEGGRTAPELLSVAFETNPLALRGEDPRKRPDVRAQLRLQPTRFYVTPQGLGRVLAFFNVGEDASGSAMDLRAVYDEYAGVLVEQTKIGLQFAIERHVLRDIQVDLVALVKVAVRVATASEFCRWMSLFCVALGPWLGRRCGVVRAALAIVSLRTCALDGCRRQISCVQRLATCMHCSRSHH